MKNKPLNVVEKIIREHLVEGGPNARWLAACWPASEVVLQSLDRKSV